MTNLLDREWAWFENEMIQPDAPPDARHVIHVAWYAGALGYQTALMNDNDAISATMRNLREEILSFAKKACIESGCKCCQKDAQ